MKTYTDTDRLDWLEKTSSEIDTDGPGFVIYNSSCELGHGASRGAYRKLRDAIDAAMNATDVKTKTVIKIEVLQYKSTGTGCSLTPIWVEHDAVMHEDGLPRIKIDNRNVKPAYWRTVDLKQVATVVADDDIKTGESIGGWIVRRAESRKLRAQRAG